MGEEPKVEEPGGEEKPGEDSSGGGEVSTEAGVSHGIACGGEACFERV